MKKRKASDQQPADFKNTPFKSLRNLAPPPLVKENKTITAGKRKEEKEEDAHGLFLRAVAGARTIQDKSSRVPEWGSKEKPDKSDDSAPPDSQLFLLAMQKIGTTIKESSRREQDEAEEMRKSASSRMKQLKRGTIRISDELDLHGFLREEAVRRLEHFVTNAFDDGEKAVLVITGKGINSSEGPVLQGAVAEWLRTRGKGMVAEFAPAPRDRGGSGAYVVFLKKK